MGFKCPQQLLLCIHQTAHVLWLWHLPHNSHSVAFDCNRTHTEERIVHKQPEFPSTVSEEAKAYIARALHKVQHVFCLVLQRCSS
jgi:hypothetical protein